VTASILDRLKPGSYFINTARGEVVDYAALEKVARERNIRVALDVFAAEPPAIDDPLRSHPNVLLSPHVAGATGQAQLNIVSLVIENLTAAVQGRPVRNVVNDVAPLVRRR